MNRRTFLSETLPRRAAALALPGLAAWPLAGPGLLSGQDASEFDRLASPPQQKALTRSVLARPVGYDHVRSVKIVRRDDHLVEQPFVPISILFRVATDELLDGSARESLRRLADALRRISSSQPGAKFSIEGHASAEGDPEFNRRLSVLRARRVESLLTAGGAVPAAAISSFGFGADFAEHPASAAEHLRQEVRRVLVVRTV